MRFLPRTFALIFAVFLGANLAFAAEPPLPNILFILSEDQGAHLGALGTAGLQTPHLDQLVDGGIYFENAFVAYPVCSASKAAFYTGVHNHTNGILNNTYNFHKPASEVTEAEKRQPLSIKNRIHDRFPTMTEILHANGYYQGVTHKLHVLPNRKFPYDEFLHGGRGEIAGFFRRAKATKQPWFLMVNIPNSHRPYPNSDKEPIRVNPAEVELPSYLPDTSEIRKDWAEYLAGIEEVDSIVGETLAELDTTGQREETLIIYVSDHGPTFQHGKMTLYDLGLRVPLSFTGWGVPSGVRSEALISELDLMPTLFDWIAKRTGRRMAIPGSETPGEFPQALDGVSLVEVLSDPDSRGPRDYVVSEISNRGPLPNDGMQERSVFDGRWKLIYREKVETRWRQVNADTRDKKPWGNRTYDETIRVKDEFPEAFRVLKEMDPQNFPGTDVPPLELYDLQSDPHEMRNLVGQSKFDEHQQRLLAALRQWARDSNDPATSLGSQR